LLGAAVSLPVQAQEVFCPADDPLPPLAPAVPAELVAAHDFTLADTPHKRTALAYLYTAWNDGRLPEARQAYWAPGSPEGERSGFPPRLNVRSVIEERDQVAVLAFAEGTGSALSGRLAGDAIVEFFRFAPSGLILAEWQTADPKAGGAYEFRD
jgi:hypothetical protein